MPSTRRLCPFALAALLSLCVAAVPPALAGGGNARSPAVDEAVPGEILAKLVRGDALAGVLARHRLTLVSRFGARPIFRLRVIGSARVEDILDAMAVDPDVQIAEAHHIHREPEARKNVAWAIGTGQAYAEQWAPQALRLAAAHELADGSGVRVAVLDTGVDAQHPLLAGRLLPGIDFVDADDDPAEPASADITVYGHGTHVAGLVAMAAPGARIVPMRVLDADGAGNAWVLAEALLKAIDPDGKPATADGVQVINLSLGSLARTRLLGTIAQLVTCELPPPGAAPLDDLSDPGYDADRQRCAAGPGAVIVAAAGNGASRDERQYPAAEGAYGLVSVAASAATGRLAAFSNSGNWIQIAAPGEGLTSSVPGGLYGTWSGTSMAAPLVAGTAALLRGAAPALSARDVVRRLTRTAGVLCGTPIPQVDPTAALLEQRPRSSSCR